jgi:hypothetical protein
MDLTGPDAPRLRPVRRLPRLPRSARTPIALSAVLVLAVAVAIPVLAASPPAPPGASEGAGHGADKSHGPEVQVTLKGPVTATTNADGETEYAITADDKTVQLEAGPPWFWGDKNPLQTAVGKTVTIVGEQVGDEVDVQSIDGTAIRPPGKPPWAGGPKAVGSIHPGWSQAKADKWAAKQQRADEKAACAAAGTCHDDPDESEAPEPSGS